MSNPVFCRKKLSSVEFAQRMVKVKCETILYRLLDSSKIDILLSKKGLKNMNTIIKWGQISVSLLFLKWIKNEMIFLPYPWINVTNINSYIKRYMYNKNHFMFDPVQKRETNWIFTGRQMPHIMVILIPYISSLNLSWIFHFFEECGHGGAFNLILQ